MRSPDPVRDRLLTAGMPSGRVPPPELVEGAFRNVHPLDRLRSVAVVTQRRCQLGQIVVRPGREPFDALPIHARGAFVGPFLRPGRRQLSLSSGRAKPGPVGRRVHLVHQTVPPSSPRVRASPGPRTSFDAVHQRRHHALRPHRSFQPRTVLGFCTAFSLIGTAGALLLPCGHRASTFLPPFPRPGFAPRASRGSRRCSTMRALTPARLTRTRQVSPLIPLCLPDIPSPTT